MHHHPAARLIRWGTCLLTCALSTSAANTRNYYIAPSGRDTNVGSMEQPFKTIARARDAIRENGEAGKVPIVVSIRGGRYYLPSTVVLRAADSGSASAPVTYRAYPDEVVTISGAAPLQLHWVTHERGVMKASVPKGWTTDQLFIDGQRMHMARCPDFDPDVTLFNGVSASCLASNRVARWSDPTTGIVHALQDQFWGSLHYRIVGRDANQKLTYEGGWQHRWNDAGMHASRRFVENILEELDAPGEWFLDAKTSTLYVYPPQGVDVCRARVEAVRLERLFAFMGTQDAPIRHLTLQGLTLTQTQRTFMKTKEWLNRSDWAICRSGAVFMEGAEDCTLEGCRLDALGGNGVFVNHYNKGVRVRGCHITRTGASAIAFVGDSAAVRRFKAEGSSPAREMTVADLDTVPGPRTSNYPQDCVVEDCLLHDLGWVEKQVAGVHISMARRIHVRHCSIYDVPRAGINIGEGCWGGHLIEYCDVFDTVRETSDHGAFNCWGRDRHFQLEGLDLNTVTLGEYRNYPLLDTVEPIIIRNSRWRCDNGWDIDLDNGASNYEVYNNLCLKGGIKFREGHYRRCENNIMVSNTLHVHFWFSNSMDVVRHNIVWRPYPHFGVGGWGKVFDRNLYHVAGAPPKPAVALQQVSGRDTYSLEGDAMFLDPLGLDFRVKEGSPALAVGFRNFAMDRFGVMSPKLKSLARTPRPPWTPLMAGYRSLGLRARWQRAVLKSLVPRDADDSAFGTDDGALFVRGIPVDSYCFAVGIRRGYRITAINGVKIRSTHDLKQLHNSDRCDVTFIRDLNGDEATVSLRAYNKPLTWFETLQPHRPKSAPK